MLRPYKGNVKGESQKKTKTAQHVAPLQRIESCRRIGGHGMSCPYEGKVKSEHWQKSKTAAGRLRLFCCCGG
jgi:hypothetical protein